MKVDKEDLLTGEGEAHEDTTLNAAVELLANDGYAGDLCRSGNITNCLHHDRNYTIEC